MSNTFFKKRDYSSYDNTVLATEEVNTQDVKINPDFYVHNCLVVIQNSLANEDLNHGMILFRQNVEYLETMSRAWDRLPEGYDDIIEEYSKSEEYTKIIDRRTKSYVLARKKLGLILKNITDSMEFTIPLKLELDKVTSQKD